MFDINLQVIIFVRLVISTPPWRQTQQQMNEHKTGIDKWPTPKAFGVGLFTDLRLYDEALNIASIRSTLSVEVLMEELPHRVKGLVFVESFKRRTFQDLIRELHRYGYIKKVSQNIYTITSEGLRFRETHETNPASAYEQLLFKMQDVFVTPAWLINRLWELNPKGQGQIIIPAPIKDWKSSPRRWEDYLWDTELEKVCSITYDRINSVLPGAFPMDKNEWIAKLKIEYEREGTLKPRRQVIDNNKKNIYFNPRARLSMAMKNISVQELLSRKNPKTGLDDFANTRAQITHRSFMIWCPRLEEFGLLMYTDYKSEIPGRLVFPTSTFKKKGEYTGYEQKSGIQNPSGQYLYAYCPQWMSTKDLFIQTLVEVYDYLYNQERIIYISTQDIRDEVCRQLRFSPKLFDYYLQKTYEASLKREIQYSISLETDLRQDMKVQINRRGVYVNNELCTLIAIKPYRQDE